MFPLKVLYAFVENSSVPLQAGVTVSSRKFRKAVQRNRVKRVLREAYRLQKLALASTLVTENKSLALFFLYTGKDLPVYVEVYEKMGIILERVNDLVKSNTAKN